MGGHKLHAWADGAMDVVFPRNCIVTGGPVNGAYRYLSDEALHDLHLIKSPHCMYCGAPFYGLVETTRSCENCRELSPVYEEGRCLFLAKDTGRAIVHEIKYKAGDYMLQDVRRLLNLSPGLRDCFSNAVLVPVPLHSRRLRERGFNQSMLIAREVSDWAGASAVEDVLIRVIDTPSQTNLDRKSRYKNVKNAFELSSKADLNSGLKYVVIDDVLTTGATLNASCSALKKGGADKLSVFALAHG